MKTKTIGVREFRQNLKKIARAASRGSSFLVTAYRKPLFRIEPPNQDSRPVGQSILEDFQKLRFHSGKKDLSKRIDEFVYYDRR